MDDPPQTHPPNSACLPPGLFEHNDMPIDSDFLPSVYEKLYELWDPKHTEESLKDVIFKTSTIDFPTIQDPDRTTESVIVRFLRLAKDNLACPWTMLIRDEYDYFVELNERAYDGYAEQGSGRIVLAHPGIGKSVFLTYFLVKRLIAQKNTYVIRHSKPPGDKEYYYSFTGDGFRMFTERRHFTQYLRDKRLDRQKGILLLDVNTIMDQGIPFFPGGHIWHVLISSPSSGGFKDWMTQNSLLLVWMQPWKWEEIYAVCHAMFARNLEQLPKLYALMGPCIRTVSHALEAENVVTHLRGYRARVNGALKALKLLGHRHLTNPISMISSGDYASVIHSSSAIFVPRPLLGDDNADRINAYLDVLSYDIADSLLDTVTDSVEGEQQLTVNILSSNPSSHTTGGIAFEAWYIRLVRRMLPLGHDFHISSIRRLIDPLAASNPDSPLLDFLIPANTIVYTFENLAQFKRLWTSSNPFVLVPLNRNQSTWDFVIRLGHLLLLIQVATSLTHSLLLTGLDDLKEFTRDSPLADVNDWKLIYVVPDDIAPSWSVEMEIKKGSGIKYRHRDVSEYQELSQYVCGVNVAKTCTTAPPLGVDPGPSNTTPRLIDAAKPESPGAGTSAGSTALGERRSQRIPRQSEAEGKTRALPGPSSTTSKRKGVHDKGDGGSRVRRKM